MRRQHHKIGMCGKWVNPAPHLSGEAKYFVEDFMRESIMRCQPVLGAELKLTGSLELLLRIEATISLDPAILLGTLNTSGLAQRVSRHVRKSDTKIICVYQSVLRALNIFFTGSRAKVEVNHDQAYR